MSINKNDQNRPNDNNKQGFNICTVLLRTSLVFIFLVFKSIMKNEDVVKDVV